ncbi:hypothetical protein ACFL3C_02625 [Patescibacteria group bacterium]
MSDTEQMPVIELSDRLEELVITCCEEIKSMDVGEKASDLREKYQEVPGAEDMSEAELIDYAIEQELIKLAEAVAREFIESDGDIEVLENFHSAIKMYGPQDRDIVTIGRNKYPEATGRHLSNLIAAKIFEQTTQAALIQPSSGELPELPIIEIDLTALGVDDPVEFQRLVGLKKELDGAQGQRAIMAVQDIVECSTLANIARKEVFEAIGFKPEAAEFLEQVCTRPGTFEDFEKVIELQYEIAV